MGRPTAREGRSWLASRSRPEGTWTEHYPELGTGPVSFEDSISPAFYELEREAIFKRAWLNVGRIEQLPRNGSYFTKAAARRSGPRSSCHATWTAGSAPSTTCAGTAATSCVWDGTPRDETCGNARQFVCKYHGWRYGLDGACTYVHQENEFFDLRKDELGLAPVHCDTWAGFIFVNLAREPRQTLRDYLGPMVGALEGYPFHEMTERYSFRAENDSNWKVFSDAFQEYYHVPPLHTHQLGPTPEARNPEYEFEGAHYQLDGPHRMVTHERHAQAHLARRASLPDRGAHPQREHGAVGRAGPRRRRSRA